MSQLYLRHSRRPSQRVPLPPLPNSIDAILAPQTRTSHQLFKTQVLNNITGPRKNDPEPLPDLDYHLLYILINLSRPYLSTRDLKRYDYLAEARKWYFIGLSKFQDAFAQLQAANTYGKMLEEQFNSLSRELNLFVANDTSSLSPSEKTARIQTLSAQLATIEITRRNNNETLRHHLLTVEKKAKSRDYATAWLSSLKWKFLQTEMPGLVDLGKQIYAYQSGERSKSVPFYASFLPLAV